MHVLIADKVERELIDALEAGGCTVTCQPELEGDAIAAVLNEHASGALIVRSTKVREPVLAAAPDSLRLIVRAGAGYDNIDHAFAAMREISVCNCPGMNAVAVAELAMGHLIALDRRLVEQTNEMRAGHWFKKEYAKARGLKGRELLVVGTGAIGFEVIRRAQAFDMRVSAQSRSLTESRARALNIGWVEYTREALLAALPRFDAVSIHVAATDHTRDMCDRAFFGAMKLGAMFVNTSRGEIVVEDDLVEAVSAGRIRAGVDVYRGQPASKDEAWETPLAKAPGMVLTHHVGASTDQAQLAVAEEAARIILKYKDTGRADHCVNGVGGSAVSA